MGTKTTSLSNHEINNNAIKKDDLFEMNEETAEISVKKPLNDYDKEEYNLILKATQVDNPLRSALSLINIKLVEISIHPPQLPVGCVHGHI